jgi:hypothetical protein
VISGVRQGCILSPILFLVTIDWMQRKTSSIKHGMQWSMVSQLEKLAFAGDNTYRIKQHPSLAMPSRLV